MPFKRMSTRRIAASASIAAFAAMLGVADAHHSFSMFDNEHPIELRGTLKEFKFITPHTFLYLTVRDANGNTAEWNLEGANAGTLLRAGWTRQTIKPGDELILIVAPLQSGAEGGSWDQNKITFGNGQPVVPPPADKH
jgi:Family of unknown function (DUF6152)